MSTRETKNSATGIVFTSTDTRPLRVLVGPLPETAGDRKQASAYLERMGQVLERSTLSEQERRAIYKQRAKWKKRASGLDARWNQYGTRAGRPPNGQGVPDETGMTEADRNDPLLKKIADKFGRESERSE